MSLCAPQVYFDIGVASSAFKPAGERTLGDKTVLPKDAEPAGRIVLGEQQSGPTATALVVFWLSNDTVEHDC